MKKYPKEEMNVFNIMKFVEKNAAHKFKLPEHP